MFVVGRDGGGGIVFISLHLTAVIYSKGMRVCNKDYSFTKGKLIWHVVLTTVTAKDKPSR